MALVAKGLLCHLCFRCLSLAASVRVVLGPPRLGRLIALQAMGMVDLASRAVHVQPGHGRKVAILAFFWHNIVRRLTAESGLAICQVPDVGSGLKVDQ